MGKCAKLLSMMDSKRFLTTEQQYINSMMPEFVGWLLHELDQDRTNSQRLSLAKDVTKLALDFQLRTIETFNTQVVHDFLSKIDSIFQRAEELNFIGVEAEDIEFFNIPTISKLPASSQIISPALVINHLDVLKEHLLEFIKYTKDTIDMSKLERLGAYITDSMWPGPNENQQNKINKFFEILFKRLTPNRPYAFKFKTGLVIVINDEETGRFIILPPSNNLEHAIGQDNKFVFDERWIADKAKESEELRELINNF